MIIQIEKEELPQKENYKYYDYPEHKLEFLIINKNDTYEVLSSFCPHFGGPLEYKNGELLCFFHDYRFDIETKKCNNRRFNTKCKEYSFKEDEKFIYIEVN